MDIHGYPWISTDIRGYPWISLDFHGYPSISMDIKRNIWKSMISLHSHGYPWTSVDIQRYQRISMDIHGHLWISWKMCGRLGGARPLDPPRRTRPPWQTIWKGGFCTWPYIYKQTMVLLGPNLSSSSSRYPKTPQRSRKGPVSVPKEGSKFCRKRNDWIWEVLKCVKEVVKSIEFLTIR